MALYVLADQRDGGHRQKKDKGVRTDDCSRRGTEKKQITDSSQVAFSSSVQRKKDFKSVKFEKVQNQYSMEFIHGMLSA